MLADPCVNLKPYKLLLLLSDSSECPRDLLKSIKLNQSPQDKAGTDWLWSSWLPLWALGMALLCSSQVEERPWTWVRGLGCHPPPSFATANDLELSCLGGVIMGEQCVRNVLTCRAVVARL